MYYLSFLLCLLSIASRVRAELSISPPGPFCEGETVTLTCIIQPSSGTFVSSVAAFRFNNSATCYVGSSINNDMTGDIDSTRYSYTGFLPGSSSANATAVLMIDPLMAIDATFPFACCGDIDGSSYEIFNNTFLLLAAPPSSANISISTTYDSTTSCTGTITLTWPAVASDINVTSYEVLLNSTNITTLSPTAGTNTYTTTSMSLAIFNGRYTVRAVSCAGLSFPNEVVFTPPTSLAPPSITYITGNSSYIIFSIASTGIIAAYYIHINGSTDEITLNTNYNVYIYIGSLIPMYGDYNFSISAGNCIGNSSNSNSIYIIGGVKPTKATPILSTAINSSSSTPIITPSSTPCPTTSPAFPPSSCICTNYTTAVMFITNTTQSSLTTPTTSSTSEQSLNSISYVAVIVILAIFLLVAIIIIVIMSICIIYSLRKSKNSSTKSIADHSVNNPTDAVHMYNYIDLNDLPQTPDTQHYYSEMNTIATTHSGDNIPEYDNNNNNNNGRPTYANLA